MYRKWKKARYGENSNILSASDFHWLQTTPTQKGGGCSKSRPGSVNESRSLGASSPRGRQNGKIPSPPEGRPASGTNRHNSGKPKNNDPGGVPPDGNAEDDDMGITCCTVTLDQELLITGSILKDDKGSALKCWDPKTGAWIYSGPCIPGKITSVLKLPIFSLLAYTTDSGSCLKFAELGNWQNPTAISSDVHEELLFTAPPESADGTSSMCVDPWGQLGLCTSSVTSNVYLIDMKTGKHEEIPNVLPTPILGGSFAPYGKEFLVWNVNTIKLLSLDDSHTEVCSLQGNDLVSVKFNPWLPYFVSSTNAGKLQVWKSPRETEAFQMEKEVEAHDNGIVAMQWSRCGGYVVTSGRDKKLKIWHVPTLKEVESLNMDNDVTCIDTVGYSEGGIGIVCCDTKGSVQTVKIDDPGKHVEE